MAPAPPQPGRERREPQPTLRESLAAGWRELALYLGAGAVYVAIGVTTPGFLFSLWVAVGYLLVFVVGIPVLARHVRRRLR